MHPHFILICCLRITTYLHDLSSPLVLLVQFPELLLFLVYSELLSVFCNF
jgi:hypothetical protein